MALTTCKECKKEISTEAESCPHCGAKKKKFFSVGGCSLLGCFGLVLTFLIFYGIGYNKRTSSPPPATTTNPATSPATAEVEQLELVAFTWGKSSDEHVTAEGQVKNISAGSIDNIQAVVTWYDKSGKFITSDNALIDYRPILRGQISPYSVIATYNPSMHHATIDFKHFSGGSIPYRQAAKDEPKPKKKRK